MDLKIDNCNFYCRLCLRQSNEHYLSNIYSDYVNCHDLIKNILQFTEVEITPNDELSKMLCENCYFTIMNWDRFKKKCLSNQNSLKKKNLERLTTNVINLVEDEDEDEDDDIEIIDDIVHCDEEEVEAKTESKKLKGQEECKLQLPFVTENKTVVSGEELNIENKSISNEKESQMESNSSEENQLELSNLEVSYLKKCKIMISMFHRKTCCCHNLKHVQTKRLFSHIRKFSPYFPVYTCYNCLLTFGDRSSSTKHAKRCPRLNLESLIRLSALRARTENKLRLYQNFKCLECNIVFGFYEDYCDHVDKNHVLHGLTNVCKCNEVFGNVDLFRKHIRKSCYLSYYCDICSYLTPNLEYFIAHCKKIHDVEEKRNFFFVDTDFDILNDNQINDYLLESKESESESPDDSFVQVDSVCGKVFDDNKKMLTNFKVVTSPEVQNIVKLRPNNLAEHEELEHAFTCKHCGMEFSNVTDLEQHVCVQSDFLLKNKISPNKCDGKVEGEENVLLPETVFDVGKEHAEAMKSFKCEEHNRTYSSYSSMWGHNKKYHPEKVDNSNYPMKCDSCDRMLSTKSAWVIHKQMHDRVMGKSTVLLKPKRKSVRRVICKYCKIILNSYDDLDAHNCHEATITQEEMLGLLYRV